GQGGVWLIHANAPEVLVALMTHDPAQWQDRYRIGYWAWETPLAPAQWVRAIRWLHEVWVSSNYVREALRAALEKTGQTHLSERIRVMPHPLLSAPPAPDRTRFGLEDTRCETLALFDVKSSPMRKNPWGALNAWLSAFPVPDKHASLTIKVSDLDPATEAVLKQLIGQRPDIRLFTERLSDADMDRFIASFDILISLHRSEGFGLGLLEAMNAGVSVVATAGSGNDFLNEDNGYPVPYRLIPINDPDGPYSAIPRSPAQVWAEPDIDAAAAILRDLVASSEVRAAKMQAARLTPSHLNRGWSPEALKAFDFNRWLDS
ncbi:MAG: glycosyltransferase, partial [Asticcacaulis sp.]